MDIKGLEIYRHKKEGLVVLWGACQMRTQSGTFVKGMLYRKLTLKAPMQKDDAGKTEHGEADMGADVYAVPVTHWVKNTRFYGNVSNVEGKRKGGILPAGAGS